MEYIQSKKIIHGDLKPSNVLFRRVNDASATPSPPLSSRDRHAVIPGARSPPLEADAKRYIQVSHCEAEPDLGQLAQSPAGAFAA
jgi:serine/threonine protein kinase